MFLLRFLLLVYYFQQKRRKQQPAPNIALGMSLCLSACKLRDYYYEERNGLMILCEPHNSSQFAVFISGVLSQQQFQKLFVEAGILYSTSTLLMTVLLSIDVFNGISHLPPPPFTKFPIAINSVSWSAAAIYTNIEVTSPHTTDAPCCRIVQTLV